MNFKTVSSLLTCLALLLSIQNLEAQKTLEYGIGMGLNSSNLITTYDFNPDNEISTHELGLGFAVLIRAEYNLKSNIRFTIDPTILFTQSNIKYSDARDEGVYISTPVKGHYNIIKDLWISSGMSYKYLVNTTTANDQMSVETTDLMDTQNLYSWEVGLNYTVKNWVEFAINYSRDINALSTYNITDVQGIPLGNAAIKNHMFQFTVIASH